MPRLLKQVIRQRDFSAGEIDETAERRDDTKLFKAACRRARNLRPLSSGSATRRPGRRIKYFDGGVHDIVRPAADTEFDITFAASRFTARTLDGEIVSSLAAPWSADQVEEMSWEIYGRRIFVCHRDFRPQVVEYDPDAGTWSIFDYAFRADIGGKERAPFFRFADYGVTLAPSGREGDITLTASAAIFKSGHVGVLFRYANRQVRITAVAGDGLSADATVLEQLPPTFEVTLDNSEGFRVGEVVEGDTSSARGEVVDVDEDDSTITVTMYKGFTGFQDEEYVVGKEGKGKVAGSEEADDPGAIVLWDEQFLSDYRGWPGSVSTDVSRLIFCDFAQLENAIIWSAITAPDDLEITGVADGAIFETVPAVCRVFAVAGGADEFVLTDRAVYYIPISADTPLTPGSVEFRRIGSAGVSNVRPIAAADGLIFVGQSKTRLYAIIATGQVTRPYAINPINDQHQHLFSNPKALAASEGDQVKNPVPALYVVNDDGTIVAGYGSVSGDYVGWFPWIGSGLVTAVAARYGAVIFSVRYPFTSEMVVGGGLDPNTMLLLHCDGEDEGEVFPDASTKHKTVSQHGAAATLVDQSKFGGAALYVDGSDDYLSVASDDDLTLDTDFTIDLWLRPSSAAMGYAIAKGANGIGREAWGIYLRSDSHRIEFYASSNGTAYDLFNAKNLGSWSADTWLHVAVCRKGNLWYFFRNGVLVAGGPSAVSGDFVANARPVTIGGGENAYFFSGYIDEVRITKGIARWTENFTPPTVAYDDTLPDTVVTTDYVEAIEAIDNDEYLDGAFAMSDWVDGDGRLPFAGGTIQGIAGGLYLGDIVVAGDGRPDIGDADPDDVALGWNFLPELHPFLEAFDGGDDMQQRMRRRKIAGVAIAYNESHAFDADGRTINSYVTGQDWSAPPPKRSGVAKYRQLGRSMDPRIEISQPVPGALTITEITTEVTV